MLLSLIICTYQRPKEVQRLLWALRSQDLIPDEVIVVDGSPDSETKNVIHQNIESLGERLIYQKVSEAERGLTRQRNAGIKLAKGQIISFLDDDTIPNNNYFTEILSCFQRYPEAVGVGGRITNETTWMPVQAEKPITLSMLRWGKWQRRDDYRWRLRKLLRLDSPLPPGWMPSFGHGRSANFPPDGNDYQVEYIMGAAFSWRNKVFKTHQFSNYFEGYGLYEDLDFCLRLLDVGSIYLCTRAQLEHHHANGGRPNQFEYGKMVVRNGWYVWRRRWPNPPLIARGKWWLVTYLLAFLRMVDLRNHGFKESIGRFSGAFSLLYNKPNIK